MIPIKDKYKSVFDSSRRNNAQLKGVMYEMGPKNVSGCFFFFKEVLKTNHVLENHHETLLDHGVVTGDFPKWIFQVD